ncbi:MAG TPA: flagellar hook-basal body complex protein FliE [Conexibacter sp.]|jgi:flagellar hook-basal body complex protein FliE|nr:flagellar hook-basal body complex protein FliE [Conexibacter sp.]
MTIPPIAPSVAGLGPEWQIPGVGSVGGLAAAGPPGAPDALGVDGISPAGSASFGDVLAKQVGNLSDLQQTAATAAQSLAAGTATDVSSVVTAVEKAQLAMQLAGQIRTKGSEAVTDIFHTQI